MAGWLAGDTENVRINTAGLENAEIGCRSKM